MMKSLYEKERSRKYLYSPEDSDSPDDYPIVKMKKTQSSAVYSITPKRLIIGTKKNIEKFTEVVETNSTVEIVENNVENHALETRKKVCSEKFTEVSATNSTVNINKNNKENRTPGKAFSLFFQSNSQPNLTNAASPDYTLTTNSTNTWLENPTVNCPSGCILSKQFSIKQSHLIQVVTDLSVQINDVNNKLDLLLARSSLQTTNQWDDTFTVPDFLTNLPVKDDTSFSILNEELKINHNKQYIIKFLAGIGGRNARSLTTNILRQILLDEVAELYSLIGKQMKNSNKKSFLRTEICKIIFQICKNL